MFKWLLTLLSHEKWELAKFKISDRVKRKVVNTCTKKFFIYFTLWLTQIQKIILQRQQEITGEKSKKRMSPMCKQQKGANLERDGAAGQ